jgi:hypothetical protein
MRKYFRGNIKLVITMVMCLLFVVSSLSTTIRSADTSEDALKNNQQKSTPTTLAPLVKILAKFKLLNWNFWLNPPHIYSMNSGNVGIGTPNPVAKLDVAGDIAINGEVIINSSGNWMGNLSGMQGPEGPQGPPGDSYWILNGNHIYNNNSGFVGIGIMTPLTKFHVNDGGVLFSGNIGDTPISGTGTRLMWIPSKAAFRAGYVEGNLWDNENIGTNSVAMGYITNANGSYSTSFGLSTVASGFASTALSDSTRATGDQSIAMGHQTFASGIASTAMGLGTNASGLSSTAMGAGTLASGWVSTALGFGSIANGIFSTAMGKTTIASGYASTALGAETVASGDYSTATGVQTIAGGGYSTSMGLGTQAIGPISTAIGRSITVNGQNSLGIGLNYNNPNWVVNADNAMSIMGGNVGIGTTNPQAALEVNGDIIVNGTISKKTSPEVVWSSDWFPAPMRTSLSLNTGTSDYNFIFGTAKTWNTYGGEMITPIMGASNNYVSPAYIYQFENSVNFLGYMYLGQLNDLGDRYNLDLIQGNIKLEAIKKTPDYDTGWFPCNQGVTYSFDHSLGVTPTFALVEVAQNSDGSGWRVPTMASSNWPGGWFQTAIVKMDATNVVVRTHGALASFYNSASGSVLTPHTGYCRIQLFNWEPDYDSGWCSISTAVGDRDKWFQHNLGKIPSLVMVYVAQNEDGSGWLLPAMYPYLYGYTHGTSIYTMTDNWAVIKGGSVAIAQFIDMGGVTQAPSSGYVRFMAWS